MICVNVDTYVAHLTVAGYFIFCGIESRFVQENNLVVSDILRLDNVVKYVSGDVTKFTQTDRMLSSATDADNIIDSVCKYI